MATPAATENPAGEPGEVTRAWLLALMAVAVAARFLALGRQSFWYDEAVSVELARTPLMDLLSGRVKDLGNPPLYPALLRLWMAVFGQSDAAVRALSAALGTATVPLVYAVGRRVWDARVGVVAALIFALAPFQVQMAQEARTYTLLTLCGVASVAALLRALADTAAAAEGVRSWRTWAPWMALGVSTGAMALAHYFGFFLAVAEAGWVAVAYRRDRRVLARAAAAYVLAALVFSFWLPSFLGQLGVQGNLARSAESWHLHLVATPLVFAVGSTLLWKDAVAGWRVVAAALAALAFGGLALLGLWDAFKGGTLAGAPSRPGPRRAPGRGLLLAWLILPVALPALVSAAASPLYNTRYVILASVPFYLFVAAGLCALPRRWALAAGGLLALVAGLSQASYYARPVKHQWRAAATMIEGLRKPGDVLLFDADYNETAYAHYVPREAAPRLRLLPPPPGAATAGKLYGAVDEGSPTADLTPRIVGHDRVWLVLSDTSDEAAERARAFFTGGASGVWKAHPPVELRGITIQLYQRP
jgi:mannosyltransferase